MHVTLPSQISLAKLAAIGNRATFGWGEFKQISVPRVGDYRWEVARYALKAASLTAYTKPSQRGPQSKVTAGQSGVCLITYKYSPPHPSSCSIFLLHRTQAYDSLRFLSILLGLAQTWNFCLSYEDCLSLQLITFARLCHLLCAQLSGLVGNRTSCCNKMENSSIWWSWRFRFNWWRWTAWRLQPAVGTCQNFKVSHGKKSKN